MNYSIKPLNETTTIVVIIDKDSVLKPLHKIIGRAISMYNQYLSKFSTEELDIEFLPNSNINLFVPNSQLNTIQYLLYT